MVEHDLYALDPAEFVPARDQLVRELRRDGKRDDAAEVKALRRPTVPAWALNQVSRSHPAAIGELVDAAAAARAAQEEVLGGADRDVLRDALERRRAALRAVARHAREVIEGSGRSAETQEREIDAGLLGVVDSTDLTDALRRGALVDVRTTADPSDDLTSMFGASLAAVPSTPGKREKAPTQKSAPKPRLTVVKNEPDPAAIARLEAAREAVRASREDERAATQRLADARAALHQAERDVAGATKEVDRAKRSVTRAERALRALE